MQTDPHPEVAWRTRGRARAATRCQSCADLLAALTAMEREFGRTYLAGSSHAVDAARAAIAKAIGITP